MDMTQKDKYMPTQHEQKLIEVLANPACLGKSVTKICQAAGVSRNFYYESMKKPEFVEFYNDLILQVMKGKVGEILKAATKYAIENSKCHQDRKMLLEMAGIYSEKKRLEHSGPGGGAIHMKLEDFF